MCVPPQLQLRLRASVDVPLVASFRDALLAVSHTTRLAVQAKKDEKKAQKLKKKAGLKGGKKESKKVGKKACKKRGGKWNKKTKKCKGGKKKLLAKLF